MKTKIPSFDEMQGAQQKQAQTNRHFGKMIVISWRNDEQPQHLLGPHFIFFICALLITTIVFVLMGISLIRASKDQDRLIVSLSIVCSLSFYVYSYVKVGLSNPGIASSSLQLSQELKSDERYCIVCKVVRVKGIVHCYSCDICIHGYDHHCPWVGKCIGRDNLANFKHFLLSVFVTLTLYSLCVYINNQDIL